MKNYPLINPDTGKEVWISRSVAVAVAVYARVNGKDCVLANKRGPGLPNHVGQWNVVSGYIDYDETLRQAGVREVFEETGLTIKEADINLYRIEDDPKRENQVILFRYYTWYNGPKDVLTNKNCEPGEVDEVKWIPLSELDKYEWTSDTHKQLIKCIFLTSYGMYD